MEKELHSSSLVSSTPKMVVFAKVLKGATPIENIVVMSLIHDVAVYCVTMARDVRLPCLSSLLAEIDLYFQQ